MKKPVLFNRNYKWENTLKSEIITLQKENDVNNEKKMPHE